MGTTTLINPFAGSQTKIVACKDENRLTQEAIDLMFEEIGVEDFNEFYILFTNGILIKRGKSKIKSSDYLNKD
jgi:hypothetical protein